MEHRVQNRRLQIVLGLSSLVILCILVQPHFMDDDCHKDCFKYTYPLSHYYLGFVEESEKYFIEFRAERENYMARIRLDNVVPWGNPPYWNWFSPTFTCPYHVQRVGTLGDGGKWICGLEEIAKKPDCIVYSFGVGGDSSFETEILAKTKCSIFAFDPTVDQLYVDQSLYEGRTQFAKIGLNSNSSKISEFTMKSLQMIMTELNHEWIDILKIDIEGAEFGALEQIMTDFPGGFPFAHLNIEFHLKDFRDGNRSDEAISNLERKEFTELWEFWRKMESMGLRPYMNEVNYLYNILVDSPKSHLIEYSFINIKPAIDVLLAEQSGSVTY